MSRIKPFFTAFLVSIVGLLWLNNVLFTHFHKLEDNSIVAHAHPFSKPTANNQSAGHQHSSEELIILDALLLLFASAAIVFVIIKSSLKSVFTEFNYNLFLSLEPIIKSNKAPPVFSVA